MGKNKAIVKIAGKEYMMAGTESVEYMHRVAIFVDKTMQELSQRYVNMSTAMTAILTAVNIADEHMKTQDAFSEMQERIAKLTEENIQLKTQLSNHKKSNISPIQEAKKLYDGMK